MSNGWIKIHRKILEWEWYDDANTFKLFVHLMLTANHAPKKWRGQVIERGQKLTSRAKLSTETKLSERQIRTCLSRLKATNEVTIKATNKQTVITLCQYETYQVNETTSDQHNDQQPAERTTSKRPASDQATNKNDKKVKKDKKDKKVGIVFNYPDNLKSDEFKKQWELYIDYRKQAKIKTLIQKSVDAQLNKLSGFGEKIAIQAIDETIANGWQGIFPEKIADNQSINGRHNGTGNKGSGRNAGTCNEGKAQSYAGATGGNTRSLFP
jgi:hypothetical protein